MKNSITYVAMDTHKKHHTLAIDFPGLDKIAEMTIANTQREITRMVKRIKNATNGPSISATKPAFAVSPFSGRSRHWTVAAW